MPPRRKQAKSDTALTYIRVSTDDQVESGLGLDWQRDKVAAECQRREWQVIGEYADEGISAKTIVNRPGLVAALELLDSGQAANLVVAKLDRLSRSVHDFTGLVDRANRNGWSLVVLDIGVDTSTATGEMMSNILASFAQFERKLIGERTSAALQVKKRAGMQLGRPDRTPIEVVLRVCFNRVAGMTLGAIASGLNADKVPLSQGGQRWYPSTIAAVLAREDAREALAGAAPGEAGR